MISAEHEPAITVPPPVRQPAYDAIYALIRRLGDHLPASPINRNALIWRAIETALDAVDYDELRGELDAYREGLGQIFLDPPGPHSPRTPGEQEGALVWHLQLTHQGIPVWICPDCVRMTVAKVQPTTCRNCGYEGDDIGEAFHPDVVFEDDDALTEHAAPTA